MYEKLTELGQWNKLEVRPSVVEQLKTEFPDHSTGLTFEHGRDFVNTLNLKIDSLEKIARSSCEADYALSRFEVTQNEHGDHPGIYLQLSSNISPLSYNAMAQAVTYVERLREQTNQQVKLCETFDANFNEFVSLGDQLWTVMGGWVTLRRPYVLITLPAELGMMEMGTLTVPASQYHAICLRRYIDEARPFRYPDEK